jgi:hypothetical protein
MPKATRLSSVQYSTTRFDAADCLDTEKRQAAYTRLALAQGAAIASAQLWGRKECGVSVSRAAPSCAGREAIQR